VSKKSKTLMLVAGLLTGGIVIAMVVATWQRPADTATKTPASAATNMKTRSTSNVPAHYESTVELKGLPPVLPASQFGGKARQAYQAAKEIPQTLAQLPCYCYCDRGMGHKSLHSCFEDDHAAHCDVCVNEALMAYRMLKQARTPAQIRQEIIAEYSNQ
jgi:hypothetical protein